MQQPCIIDVADLIDSRPIGRLQITAAVLCGAVATLDGLDNFAIALVAPAVAHDLGFAVSSFGLVFGMNAFGMMVGAMAFGQIGDRFGRKPVILASMMIIGLFTLLTPATGSLIEVAAVRFLIGVGAGGVMPNIVALTAEYAPKRLRATLVTLMFAGITLGSILAGVISSSMMDTYGWRGVFYVGGVIPFLLLPVLLFALPESLRTIVARGVRPERALAILRRLDPPGVYPEHTVCRLSDGGGGTGAAVVQLFQDGRSRETPLIWSMFFCNLLVWYFLISWLPSVLQRANFDRSFAVTATLILYGGGIAGGLLLSRLFDRNASFKLLVPAYLAASVFVAATGWAATTLPSVLLPALFGAGFFVGGCQFCITAIVSGIYPTELRSTGVGWALGVGRLGAIVGPVIGGVLIGLRWDVGQLLLAAAVPALLAGGAALLLERSGREASRVAASAAVL